jgi:hypothetical protein
MATGAGSNDVNDHAGALRQHAGQQCTVESHGRHDLIQCIEPLRIVQCLQPPPGAFEPPSTLTKMSMPPQRCCTDPRSWRRLQPLKIGRRVDNAVDRVRWLRARRGHHLHTGSSKPTARSRDQCPQAS